MVSWPCDVESRGSHIDLVHSAYDWRALAVIAKCISAASSQEEVAHVNTGFPQCVCVCVSVVMLNYGRSRSG